MEPSLWRRMVRKLDKTLAAPFFIDQWIILAGFGVDYTAVRWEALTPLMPDKDRYWGDPFVLRRDGGYFVFVEEKLYATGRGRIACLELDAGGKLISNRVALEREHHLSYPFIFDRGQDLYMIPESAGSRTVDLYHCTRFPDAWERVKTLLGDIYAVDATLLEHAGRAWLFANVKQEGGSSLNALHLFWAEDLMADAWHAHPRNPVVRDIGSARPAGRIFMQGESLIRPSQDSSRRYGHALKFNRITRLDEEDYGEETISVLEPGRGMRATHTFNQAGELTVLDAVIRRRR